MNITKEGTEVKKGQLWQSLDFGRDCFRVCKVESIVNGRAEMVHILRKTSPSIVSVCNMHKHARGWKLIGTTR